LPAHVDLVGVLPAILLLLVWIAGAFSIAALLLEHRDLE